MGKTPKKLQRVILVTDHTLRETPEIQALAAKGHCILSWAQAGNMVQPDLILGPNCRMVTAETVKYVGLALKELGKARKSVLEEQTLDVGQPEKPVEEEEDEDEPV